MLEKLFFLFTEQWILTKYLPAGLTLKLEDLQQKFGPTCYKRTDFHLKKPVPKKEMVARLEASAPATMAGQTVRDVHTYDGIKFVLADDSWLLIRPSGTEPVLRVYSEAPDEATVDELLAAGRAMTGQQ